MSYRDGTLSKALQPGVGLIVAMVRCAALGAAQISSFTPIALTTCSMIIAVLSANAAGLLLPADKD